MMFIKLLLNVTAYIFYALIILTVFLTITSYMSIAGGLRSFLIRSGSMEPTILTGDVIIIQPASNYQQHDVVTFYNQDNRIVTHRITTADQSSDSIQYHTKGDANRSTDQDSIQKEQILGKVIFIVPKLGFLASFVKTPQGIISMIVIPAIIIFIDRMISFNLKGRK